MPAILRAAGVDNTIPFLREAYTFISRRCDGLGSDLFSTRIMLTPVVCMRGADAAQFFYDGGRFTRQGAMPQTVLRLLQDKGSIQGLDGAAHRARKAMFMSLMSPDRISHVAELLERHWHVAVAQWASRPEVTLLPEIGHILSRTACDWVGVPLTERQAPAMSRELQAMIRGAGQIGPGTLHALTLRRRTERRMRRLVRDVRAGRVQAEGDSPLATIARHRDIDGAALTDATAAVEIINLLRPMVAVNRFITFAALALHQHPAWRRRLAGDEGWLEPFVQEVRRFYPFFPVIGGRALMGCDWGGHHFAAGDWVILDLYGTNHDRRLWEEPEQFQPERFKDWPGHPYTFIPQGAGDFMTGHRCPGEWITIALIKRAVRLLCGMRYEVPPQDLSISLSEMPAAPRSGLVISQVCAAEA
ncbi:cytochrome P450 [Pseudoroseomonas ludipueritiae]|uniref:Cytochrome P450 n=1 Tax=Pseudoroseomonas ludipueritiae TaxID=198093 RepID=A0ABR7R2D9_9PROT|nr:cytochrome P450 [Pseudoroseomonas ludipueritiae]MBC9175842.1 cytochrome P450 [Pseudoroseomonas ludipueritiae]